MVNDHPIRRRSLVKRTGGCLGAAGVFPGMAAANSEAGTSTRDDITLLEETERYRVTAVRFEEDIYVNWVEKSTFSVSQRRVSVREFKRMSLADLGIDGNRIEPVGHDEIIVRSTATSDVFGPCWSTQYHVHNFVSLSIETGDTLSELSQDGLEAAICAVVGAVGGKLLSAVAAIGCYLVSVLILDHVDLSGETATWGAWDCHRGWFHTPNVCHGVTGGYGDGRSAIPSMRRIPNYHIEQL